MLFNELDIEFMGIGTIKDFVRNEIFLSLDFEPRGTKKTIDEMIKNGDITPKKMRRIYRLEADKMVSRRFLKYDLDKKIYVFSKDNGDKYFWQLATLRDRAMNCILNLASD